MLGLGIARQQLVHRCLRSQTPVEQAHIVRGFRFELTRVQTPAVRERMVASLANVAPELAQRVAEGLGIPVPPALPRALESPPTPEVKRSPALSLMARPGDGSIAGRRVAILVADGLDTAGATAVHEALTQAGAVPRFVGARLGTVAGADGGDSLPDRLGHHGTQHAMGIAAR